MILRRGRFGLVGQVSLAATLFALGVAVGANAPARVGQAAAAPDPGRAIASAAMATHYPVEVVRIIDGDTFEARVRAWPGIEIATKVRLRNIDAPEMRARCEQERALAHAAREALVGFMTEGAVSISQVGLDKYGGRVLALASTGRTPDVSAALLEAGVARRYSGGRREGWCAAL